MNHFSKYFGIGMLITIPAYFIYPFADDNIFIYVLGLPFTVIGLFFVVYATKSKKESQKFTGVMQK